MNQLYLLAAATALFFATRASAQDYNIKNYGAPADTLQLSTAAINRAVADCFQHGGGRVVIPAGNFRSGTVTLKDHVELYLARGATLYASTNPTDFPRQAQPAYRSQKDAGGWYALIYAEGVHHIGISGDGTIDGQGARQLPRKDALSGDQDGRPRNILFISCKQVQVKDVSLRNSGVWNQHYLNCEDVTVTGIKVFNHSNRNNDGIDIDGCRRFILANSIIDSDDDGVVLKSTGPAGCADVVVANCIISSFTNALKCGTESTGGFRNIIFANCTVKPSISLIKSVFKAPDHGISAISLEIVDGGIMEGVNVHDIQIEGTECPIYVRLANRARKYREDAPEPPLGQMKNIAISHITALHTGNYASSITGIPGAKIQNIILSDIQILSKGNPGACLTQVKEDEKGYPEPTAWKNLPASGLYLRHVNGITLRNCEFHSEQPDPRPPIVTDDVQLKPL